MNYLQGGDQVFFRFVNKYWVKYKKENINKRLFNENFLNSVQNENTQFATMSFSNRKKNILQKMSVINNFRLIHVQNINIVEQVFQTIQINFLFIFLNEDIL